MKLRCDKCGSGDYVRLTKGTHIKNLTCLQCGSEGTMIRDTDYDRQRRKEKGEGVSKLW